LFPDDSEDFSAEQLRKASKACGLSLTKQELERMIEQADANGDGFVDKQEFIQIMLKTNLFREEM